MAQPKLQPKPEPPTQPKPVPPTQPKPVPPTQPKPVPPTQPKPVPPTQPKPTSLQIKRQVQLENDQVKEDIIIHPRKSNMKELFLVAFIMLSVCSFAQKKTTPKKDTLLYKDTSYINKNYIFNYNANIQLCDGTGKIIKDSTSPTIAYKHYSFTVDDVDSSGDLIIRFHTFKKFTTKKLNRFNRLKNKKSGLKYRQMVKYKRDSTLNQQQTDKFYAYNSKYLADNSQEWGESDERTKFFRITKEEFDNSHKVLAKYHFGQGWDFTYGALTVPFKIRNFYNPSNLAFTPNLSLGGGLYGQYKINKNFSLGFVTGISVSSITLDSASTKGVVKATNNNSNTRSSFTPTFQFLAAYKTINVIFGWGWDFINLASNIESSWIYQGKPWIGVGIGVSLFNGGITTTTTSSGQTIPKK